MNQLHFVSDSADNRIQIWISQEVRIPILDHFSFRFWPWRRFALALSKQSLVTIILLLLLLFLPWGVKIPRAKTKVKNKIALNDY